MSKLVTSKIEVLVWHDSRVRKPDNGRRVMVQRHYGSTVEFAAWERKSNRWIAVDRYELLDGEVPSWCEMPKGVEFKR